MKPIVLTFTGHYLPGYKAGGILQNLVNTIDVLHTELDFWIVTRDRDLGDKEPYDGIKKNQWQSLGNAMVYYLSSRELRLQNISELITNTRHDMLYLTSLFDALTIKPLLLRKMRLMPDKPVIVEPNGEFGWASFKQKYAKKIIFVQAAKLFGIYNHITWRAAGESEQEDIIKYMKVKPDSVHVAAYLPEKSMETELSLNMDNGQELQQSTANSSRNVLRVIFLSRLAPEKNLDYALKALKHVTVDIKFDIYGPIEHIRYWKKCQELITKLPANVNVNYLGKIQHDDVRKILSLYDLLFLPSAGEAYGMVIAESLSVGTPVLISDKTAWRDLESDNLGWDFPLKKYDHFVKAIEYYSSLTSAQRKEKRKLVKENIRKRLFDPAIIRANRALFYNQAGI